MKNCSFTTYLTYKVRIKFLYKLNFSKFSIKSINVRKIEDENRIKISIRDQDRLKIERKITTLKHLNLSSHKKSVSQESFHARIVKRSVFAKMCGVLYGQDFFDFLPRFFRTGR